MNSLNNNSKEKARDKKDKNIIKISLSVGMLGRVMPEEGRMKIKSLATLSEAFLMVAEVGLEPATSGL